MKDKQIEVMRSIVGDSLTDEQFVDLTRFIDTFVLPQPVAQLAKFAGHKLHAKSDAQVITIFRVGDKYYHETEWNREVMSAFVMNGDKELLTKLEKELEY